jgi:GNAT superfamily N-acetyltransferase
VGHDGIVTGAQVRPAGDGDAEQLGLIHVRSWQGAYQGLMPQDFLDQLDPASRAQGWRSVLRAGDDQASVLVAAGEAGVSGFVSFGPSRDPDADPKRTGEVFAIYVLPGAWSTGQGRLLMAAAASRSPRFATGAR